MTERMYGGYPESCIREGLFQLEGEQVMEITKDLLAERDALREALDLLIKVVEHANQGAFDNGVYGPEGQNEGVYLASRAVDGARALLTEGHSQGTDSNG